MDENRLMDCIADLKAAVVRQACDDYCWLRRHPGEKIIYDHNINRKRPKVESERTIKQFFRSRLFTFWCGADGDLIMERLDKNMAAGFKYHKCEEFE